MPQDVLRQVPSRLTFQIPTTRRTIMSEIYGLSPENVARKRGIVDKSRHQRSRKYSSKFHHNLYP
eukprot:scaffold36106_cov228-Skeletonema_dohrnii-CCMP3373.AAC.1